MTTVRLVLGDQLSADISSLDGIDVAIVDTVPLGVDTPEDLDRARELLAPPRARRAGKKRK